MEILLSVIIILLVILIALVLWTFRADGEMVVEEDGNGTQRFSLDLNGDPSNFAHKRTIRFRVVNRFN
jgi:hypothetical protein